MEQGRIVEEACVAVAKGEENLVRYTELKVATGCHGISTPIVIFNYTDSTTFF